MAENNPLTDKEILHCIDCKWYGDCRCHRYPPKIFKYGDAKWAIVNANDFCGEGVPKEQKVEVNKETLKSIAKKALE